MVNMICLVNSLAGELYAQLFEGFDIHIGQHDRGVCLTAFQFRQLFQRSSGHITVGGTGGKGDQNLIRMQTRILAFQIIHLELLDRLDGFGRNNMQFVVN